MWPKRTSNRARRSVGGGNSIREALRNRGGATIPTAVQSEAEFEAPAESEPEKSGLEWLNLNAFAPRAMQRVAEKLLNESLPAAVLRRGADSDAEEAGSRSFRVDGISSESEEGADLSAIPPPGTMARVALAANGGRRPPKKEQPKKATGLRAALLARGGMQRANTMPVTVNVPDDLVDASAGGAESPAHSSPPLASSPLPSVEEDLEAEAADHEAIPEGQQLVLRPVQEAEAVDREAVPEEGQQPAPGPEEAEAVAPRREVEAVEAEAGPAEAGDGGAAPAPAAAEADAEAPAAAEAEAAPAAEAEAGAEVPRVEEEATPAPDVEDKAATAACEATPAAGAKEPQPVAADVETEIAREEPHEGAAPATADALQVAGAAPPVAGGSSDAKATEADAGAVSSAKEIRRAHTTPVQGAADEDGDAAKQQRAVVHKVVEATLPPQRIERSQTESFSVQHFNRPQAKSDVDRPMPWRATLKAREEAKPAEKRDDAADRTKEAPRKLKDLQQFWGKNSIGFAGPQLGTKSKLSKTEAQAALQRLIAAGNAVDFDEVRRLRKMTAEAKD